MTMMNDLTAYGRAIMDTLETGLADKVTGRLSELDADLPKLTPVRHKPYSKALN